ncbi:MAG: glycosyltransferase family 1 protein, partial [Chloroflexi bacterium]|nr:glycosyltransferase family 1 protein [Chloroflexota bacterium]
MRIAIDASRTARPELTGTEIYSLYLLRTLLARPARHDYVLYFNQPPAPGLLPRASTAEKRVVPLRRLWTHVRLAAALA